MWSLRKDKKGFMLMWSYLVAFTMTTLMCAYFTGVITETRGTNSVLDAIKSFQIAEAGIDRMIGNLNNSITGDIGWTDFGDGEFQASYVALTPTSGSITAIGRCGNASRTVAATVSERQMFKPRGSITAYGGFGSSASLNLLFDGNDYDANGVPTGGAGIYGVSVVNGDYFSPGKLTSIGGNGHPPMDHWKYLPGSYETGVTVPNDLTPEGVLGLDEGDLDEYKTNEAPPPNFDGVYYVECDHNIDIDFGEESKGVLIIKESGPDASIASMTGNFEGILIIDNTGNSINFMGEMGVLGCVYTINTNHTFMLAGDNATFRYSSEVIEETLREYFYGKLIRYLTTSWMDTENDYTDTFAVFEEEESTEEEETWI